VKKFVSDLQQVTGFLPGTPVSSTNKTERHDLTEIFLKVPLSIIIQNLEPIQIMNKTLVM
jgi:hypothetical protein